MEDHFWNDSSCLSLGKQTLWARVYESNFFFILLVQLIKRIDSLFVKTSQPETISIGKLQMYVCVLNWAVH